MKKENWIWMPHPGHLCVCNQCQFRLNTYVGKYIVSTLGEYYPVGHKEMKTLGSGDKSFYETMVFKAVKSKYECCPYEIIASECKDCIRYETAEEAFKGHLKLCNEWSKK